MFNYFTQSICELAHFGDDEVAAIVDKLLVKTYAKDEYLIGAGEICMAVYFVESGSFRQYLQKDDAEITVNLVTEKNWCFDQRSFLTQKPSKTFIQAFEESLVYILDIHAIHALIAESQTYLQLGKLFAQASGGDNHHIHRASPERRYMALMSQNPMVLQKFPLNYVASYLEMTPETLSRVRRKITSEIIS